MGSRGTDYLLGGTPYQVLRSLSLHKAHLVAPSGILDPGESCQEEELAYAQCPVFRAASKQIGQDLAVCWSPGSPPQQS